MLGIALDQKQISDCCIESVVAKHHLSTMYNIIIHDDF